MSAEKSFRVIHLINSLAVGGAERFVLELFQEWEKTDSLDLQLVLLHRAQPEYDFYRPRREPICLGFRSAWRDWRSLRKAVQSLRQIIRSHRADVIHTHLWISDLIGALAARREGICHISHIHNELPWMTSPRLGFRFRRWIFASALRRAKTFMIWPAERPGHYTKIALGLGDEYHAIIPHGINLGRIRFPRAARDDKGGVTLGTLGRFVPEKGHLNLLAAAKALVHESLQFRIFLGGHGSLEDAYRRYIHEHSLEPWVTIAGRVTDLNTFFGHLDIYVQPSSSSECLPVVILEAFAAGLPVVATDVGGISEVVRNDLEGFVVPPNDVDALTAALRTLMSDANARLRFGENARKRAQAEFSIETAARRIEALYYRLVEGEMTGCSGP